MELARLVFAASQTFHKSVFMIVGCPIILLMCWICTGANLTLTGTLLVTVTATLTVCYVVYWLKFYYQMYMVSDIYLTGNWTDPRNPHRLLLYRHIQVGHREAFARKASVKILAYVDNPNAILYGDIVVVGSDTATHAEIEDTLREHRKKIGLRWNNNFPVGKGVKGFVNMSGNFHSLSPVRQNLAIQ